MAFYLQNVHIQPRNIYLTVIDNYSESCVDMQEDSQRFCIDLATYIQREQEGISGLGHDLSILAGSTQIHADTVKYLRSIYSCYYTPLLDELRGGDYHNLTRDEFQVRCD